MKKIRKNDLKLEKEVISRLSANDLSYVKGGASVNNVGCVHPVSYVPAECMTVLQNTCQLTVCGGCQTGDNCHVVLTKDNKNSCPCVYSDNGNCPPPAKLTDFC